MKHLFQSVYLLIFLLSLLFSNLLFSQSKDSKTHIAWENKLQSFYDLYHKGYYKEVRDYSKSYIKKIKKNHAYTHSYASRFFLTASLGANALNKFDEKQAFLDSAIANLKLIPKDNEKDFVINSFDLANYYQITGFYKDAEDILINFQSQNINSLTNYQKLKLKRYLINIYVAQGRLNQANKLLQEINLESAIFATNTKVDDNNTPIKKLPKHQIKERILDHAHLMNNVSTLLLKKGNYQDAAKEIDNSLIWIKEHLGSKNVESRQAKSIKGDYYLKQNDFRRASKIYYQSYMTGGFKVSENEKLAINRKLLKTYIELNKVNKYKKQSRKLQINSKRYYGKNCFYYADYKLIEIDKNIDRNNNRRAKNLIEEFNLDFNDLPKMHPAQINYINSKYEMAIRLTDVQKAESLINEKLNLVSTLYGKYTPEYHKVLLQKAHFIVKFENKLDSINIIKKESYDKVVKPEISITNNDYSLYLNTFADYEEWYDHFDKAEEYMQEALNSALERYGDKHINYAFVLQQLSKIKLEKGQYKQAETLLNQSFEIAKSFSPQSDERVIEIYRGISNLYFALGNFDEAKNLLNKALNSSYKIKAEGELNIASSADQLAMLYMNTGRYTDAEELLLEAIKVKESKLGNDNKDLISTLNNLGKVYLSMGDYAESEKNIRNALAISTKLFGDTSLSATQSMILLKELYLTIGDLARAESFAKQILKNQKRILGKEHITTATSLASLAMIQLKRNKVKLSEIEKMLNQAIDITKNALGEKSPAFVDLIENKAIFYLSSNKFDKADTSLAFAQNFWEDKLSKYNLHSANIWMTRGEIEMQRNNYKKAKYNFEKAQKIFETIFSDKHPDYVNASSKLARVFYIEGDKKNAIQLLEETTNQYLTFTKMHFPSLTFSEKTKYWNKIREDFEFFNFIVLSNPNEVKSSLIGEAYNNVISTKALLLNSTIQIRYRILNSGDTVLINKYNQLIDNKELLTSVISLSNQQQKDMGIDVKNIEKNIESLEKELSQRSEDFAQNEKSDNFTWKDIKASLKDNEYAVEIVRFRYFDKTFTDSIVYAALIVSKETKNAPEMVIIPNGKQLETRYLKYYLNANKFKNFDKYSYTKFWKPIKDKIPDGTTIYMSLDGVYCLVNMEMLPISENKYAIDQNDFIVVKNTKEIAISDLKHKVIAKKKGKNKSVSENSNQVYICSNPQFYINPDSAVTSQTVANLPGAEKEGDLIASISKTSGINTVKLTGEQVDEEKVKEIKSPKVLHFATHGTIKADVNDDENEYLANPMLNSGLLMRYGGNILDEKDNSNMNIRNGVLTAFEASSMNLDGTELVMMSACETGVGQVQTGEGVQGLQYGFLIAGAQSVGMTLFKVNDEITMKLMEVFYKKYLGGMDKRKAFAEAKKAIKDEYKYPIYWGSFVLIGID